MIRAGLSACIALAATPGLWAAEAATYRPVLSSHGTEAVAFPEGSMYIGVPPLRVHPGAKVGITLSARARRLKVSLDCSAVRLKRHTARQWSFRMPSAERASRRPCLGGRLDVLYGEKTVFGGDGFRFRFELREHSHAPVCDPPGSVTVAANAAARVYTLVKRPGDRDYREWLYFACRFDEHYDHYIGESHSGDAYGRPVEIKEIRLAGDKLAYVTTSCDCRYSNGRVSLTVLDTRSWSVDHLISGGYGGEHGGSEGDEYGIHDVELRPTGSVAWIIEKSYWNSTQDYEHRYEVRKADATGTDVLVDAGNIELQSLALTGTVLTWLRDGEQRTAALE